MKRPSAASRESVYHFTDKIKLGTSLISFFYVFLIGQSISGNITMIHFYRQGQKVNFIANFFFNMKSNALKNRFSNYLLVTNI